MKNSNIFVILNLIIGIVLLSCKKENEPEKIFTPDFAKFEPYVPNEAQIVNENFFSHHLKKMADAGWLVDLNRSMQTVSGSGNNLRAFTVMEMRFRKPD